MFKLLVDGDLLREGQWEWVLLNLRLMVLNNWRKGHKVFAHAAS
jgi:hypothetical protein